MLHKIGVSSYLRVIDNTVVANKDKENKIYKKYSLAIALTLRDPLPNILLTANRIKVLSNHQLAVFQPSTIVNFDNIIMKYHSNNQNNDNDNKENQHIFENIDKLKS